MPSSITNPKSILARFVSNFDTPYASLLYRIWLRSAPHVGASGERASIRSVEERPGFHRRRHWHAEAGKHGRRKLQLV